MSSITNSVQAYLDTKTTVTNYVSDRITTNHRDQGAGLPAITVHGISGGHIHDLNGSAGVADPRIQVSIWSETDSEADAIAEAVRLVMQGFPGAAASGTMGTHTVLRVLLDNTRHLYEPPESGKGIGIYHIAQDYRILHTEAIPVFS